MTHRFTAPFLAVLVLALAAFTGSALAGDNHGSGSGDSGKAAQQDKQSSTSADQPATGGDNSKGVKPSNTTKHDTYAKASSDQTKQYGNGKTAGQIATQAGHGDATLHGPGNSQPHKTAACPGGHEVDVHALKNKDSKCGTSQETKQVNSPDTKQVNAAKVEVKKSEKVDVKKAKSDEEKSESSDVEKSENDVTKTEVKQVDVQKVDVQKVDVEKAKSDEEKSESSDVEKSENGVPATPATLAASASVSATAAPAASAPAAAAPAASAPATAAPAASAPAAVAPATSAAGAVQGAHVTLTPAGSSPTATPASAGGVKGVAIALRPTKTKPAGGVLGTTTRLGGTIASTRLPFTGLPLWIFALVAAGLVGIGLTVRRASAHRI